MLTAALCHVLETHPMGLEVDLTGVEFFDSAALRSLERVRAYAELRGRRLVLDYWSSAVDLVFELAAAFETTHGPVG
jgi:anti-anti-sigma regulatory factor